MCASERASESDYVKELRAAESVCVLFIKYIFCCRALLRSLGVVRISQEECDPKQPSKQLTHTMAKEQHHFLILAQQRALYFFNKYMRRPVMLFGIKSLP
jgi:hypothetical protein